MESLGKSFKVGLQAFILYITIFAVVISKQTYSYLHATLIHFYSVSENAKRSSELRKAIEDTLTSYPWVTVYDA